MATQGPGQSDPRQPGNVSKPPPLVPPGGAAPRPVPMQPGVQPAPAPIPPRPVAPVGAVNAPRPAPVPTPAPAPTPGAAPRPVPASAAPRPVLATQKTAAAIRAENPGEEEEEPLDEKIKKWVLESSPSMLVSMVVHLVLIVLLALWIFHNPKQEFVELEAVYTEELGQQMINEQFKELSLDDNKQDVSVTADVLKTVEDPFATMPELKVDFTGEAVQSEVQSSVMGLALAGRDPGKRAGMLGKYGGNQLSEGAVEMGLAWLAKNQQKNGAWSLKGPYSQAANSENHEAATAMALLCFLASNHTHRGGKYRVNVANGLNYLLKQQQADGLFFRAENHDEILYTQAQCTFALAEMYGMTNDSTLQKVCQAAVDYCVESQDLELGGWRYNRKEDPAKDSDVSVTGWMVLALASAKKAKLDVPDDTLDRVHKFLSMATPDKGSQYAYQAYSFDKKAIEEGAMITGLRTDQRTGMLTQATPPMTAEGLLCRLYLSQFIGEDDEWSINDERVLKGVQLLLDKNLPTASDRDVYYWYYGTQTMFQVGGEAWQKWNGVLRDMLVESQTTKGAERGSWEVGDYVYGPESKPMTPDLWAQRGKGGRLYVTCMSIFMLEVYYRHMRISEAPVKKGG